MAIISQKTRAFLNSEHLSAAAPIMIISYVGNEPLARYWLNMNLNLKINYTEKRLVSEIIYIYRYSKCYLMLNLICIFCLSWKFFYSRGRISILFYIYDSHKSLFIHCCSCFWYDLFVRILSRFICIFWQWRSLHKRL